MLAFASYIAVIVFALLPLVWAWRFDRYIAWRSRNPFPAPTRWPQVAVILPLRGADPSIERCLAGLLNQDYSPYSVRIVVDSVQDPAWEMVQSALTRERRSDVGVQIEVLDAIGAKCSLKVSAQRQAISQLDGQVEVVAFLDGDSIPAADWLRSMIVPLSDPKVGVASGIRWFTPTTDNLGSWIRHLNNCACFMNMYIFKIPWGGSMAIRRTVIDEAGLLAHWSQCFCEDVSVHGPVTDLGLSIIFVPAATQFNAETIDARGAYRFILRQFLCAHLHHRRWPVVLACNLLNFAALQICFGAFIIAVVIDNWALAAAGGLVPAIYLTGMLVSLRASEMLLRQQNNSPPPIQRGWWPLIAIVPTILVSMYAMIAVLFIRRITWRGVTYDIEPTGGIRLREYRPYRNDGGTP